jgi:hypothetical protein
MLYLLPIVLEICYYKMRYINVTRGFCHGNILQGDKVAFVTHVFACVKEFVLDNLRLGLFVSQVLAKHCKNVQKLVQTNGNLTRDTFLCEQDIQNIVGKLTKGNI